MQWDRQMATGFEQKQNVYHAFKFMIHIFFRIQKFFVLQFQSEFIEQ